MPTSIALWVAVGFALLLFWAVGAYNRLMRLRTAANTAFARLELELTRQLELVRELLPQADIEPNPAPGESSFWAGLQGAAGQFAAALAAVRAHPLDAPGMAALSAAQGVLAMAWAQALDDAAHDLAGARLPDTVTARHAQLVMQAQAACEQFNLAVARYNQAVAQFPAVLLAWVFGFRPARGIGPTGQLAPP